jgi:predicted nucleic acid-binding protein
MDFEKKFDFINSKLEMLMTIGEISSRDYVKISKQLIRAEDDIDLLNVMTEMAAAVIMEQKRKEKEKNRT